MTSQTNTRTFTGGIAERLSSVLKNLRISTKDLARAGGRTPKAAERWLAGDNAMSVETLFALAREFDEVWEFVCKQTGRDQASAAETLDQLKALLEARRST